jgi:hypothetical protein
VLQSEYNFCLSPSRPLLLQSEYNFCLSLSRILLPQSECTFCLNPSRPYILLRERESFFTISPLPSPEKVCGQLLIRSILVLLFSFEVPWTKKLSKKSCSKKKEKEMKKATTKKELCVCFLFLCAVVLYDYLCVQAHVSSTVYPRTSILPPLNDF